LKILLQTIKMNKKAQITVFAIISVLLIAAIGLLFFLYQNNVFTNIGSQQEQSEQVLEECVNNYISESLKNILKNAGTINEPTLTKNYGGENISYLCYTNLPYARCTPQIPLLIENAEKEITDYLGPKIDSCFNELVNSLEENSYDVELGSEQNFSISLTERGVRTNINRLLTQEKANDFRSFESFEINHNSNIYKMLYLTQEIISQETTICNSEYVELMRFNPDIEITKLQTGDDNKIYKVKHLTSLEELNFAIKNCVLVTPG